MAYKILLSFDVEHWYLGLKFRGVTGWQEERWRDYQNIETILSILGKYNSLVTFFITGQYAEDYPDIVKRIHKDGHEIACHGYSHEYIYNQSPKVFKEETIRSKAILSDLINIEIKGYRAASWSITKDSLWALEIIEKMGFIYDSSIYPIMNHRYGLSNAPAGFYNIKFSDSRSLVELSPQTLSLFKYKIPVGGGIYLRLMPFWFNRLAFKKDEKKGLPGRVMLHPHELDPRPTKLKVPFEAWLIRYFRIRSVSSILQRMLEEYDCISYEHYYERISINQLPVVDFTSLKTK